MRHLKLLTLALFIAGCSSGGGYYQDDGPPRRASSEVMNTPDAVPRNEPPSATGNQPYTALGKTYYPVSSAQGYVATGYASWYGTKYHGNRTSSGETYDMYKMTAAHPTLPLPSYVRVTNLDGGQSVVVRVNDRGPFLNNRIIDLSYAAAAKLNMLETGTARVEVRAVFPPDSNPPSTANAGAPVAQASGSYPPGLVSSTIISEPLDESGGPGDPVPASAGAPGGPVSTPIDDQPAVPAGPPPAAGPQAYLQIGVFGQAANADSLMQTLRDRGFPSAGIWTRDGNSGQTLYEVSVGPLSDQEKDLVLARLRDLGYQPFTVMK